MDLTEYRASHKLLTESYLQPYLDAMQAVDDAKRALREALAHQEAVREARNRAITALDEQYFSQFSSPQ